jgi:hypothetical protein
MIIPDISVYRLLSVAGVVLCAVVLVGACTSDRNVDTQQFQSEVEAIEVATVQVPDPASPSATIDERTVSPASVAESPETPIPTPNSTETPTAVSVVVAAPTPKSTPTPTLVQTLVPIPTPTVVATRIPTPAPTSKPVRSVTIIASATPLSPSPTQIPTPAPAATPTNTPVPVPVRKLIVVQGVDSESDWMDETENAGPDSLLFRLSAITSQIQNDAQSINSTRSETDEHVPILSVNDVVTFSYSGVYFDTATGEEVTVENHSGTGRHYVAYTKAHTCSGVVAGAEKLDQLVERIVELNPQIRIDIVSHSMGGVVSAYLLSINNAEHLDHIASVTTLDSPLQGTNLVDGAGAVDAVWDVSVCLTIPRSTQAHFDLLPGSSAVNVIAALESTARAKTFYSIKSELELGAVSVGSPLPDEPVWVVKCGGNWPPAAHSCVWFYPPVLSAISRLINLDLPTVPRLKWTDGRGREITVVDRGEIVTPNVVGGNVQNGVVDVTIYEVDPNSPDDLVAAGVIEIVDWVGSVNWTVTYESDFFGFGGDPEYKFVVSDTSWGELVVR